MSDSRIDSTRRGEFSIEVDNLTFFKNNEYNSSFQKGYTLPGFWLQLKNVYQPFNNLILETGFHSLWFWGADLYPAYAYRELAAWNGKENAYNVHILPFLRANIAFSKHLNFAMGNIYGGVNHKLIEPLYNPELNLISDPETGMQLLFKSKFFDFDLWLDWQNFIFKNDTHHEAFVSGISSKIKANDEKSRFHVYFPIQNLIRHKGGEIDTMSGAYTTINTAAGAGIRYSTGTNALKNISLEFDFLFNKNPKDTDIPFNKGKGYYGKLAFQLKNFNISTSYWKSDNFISMYGNPFYGSVSYKKKGVYFHKPSMLHVLAEYVYPIGKGFDLGINTEIFCFLTGYMYSMKSKERYSFKLENNRNFSFGIYLHIHPEFLIKL
ncbi:MAG: hypothetical protein LBD80_09455 [Tannerella sp.]|nr:hypothetical protein [Tannerella sp.]